MRPRIAMLCMVELNNPPVGQENDAKYSVDWSLNRVRKAEKPMRYLGLPETPESQARRLARGRNWSPSLPQFPSPSYDPWRAPFIGLEHVFKFSASFAALATRGNRHLQKAWASWPSPDAGLPRSS
jgi:hypothetical protein